MASLLARAYNPDVLSCIANLSNDEVFTPPELANRVLDMLPKELWSDPSVKILDPFCKSGVFLREAAKRFIKGLAPIYPDLQERVDYIMHEQLYGIAVTELTSLLSRRSLYCSKYPNGIFSVSKFDDAEGNVRFRNIPHTWANGRCKYCGASEKEYKRSKDLETYAYELIHTDAPERIFNMKFDVIVGNPPYQLSDGGNAASAMPIYQKFVEQAKKLNPCFLTMIIPSRWFTGGRGLDGFRDEMLHDERIREIHDFHDASEVFPGVEIKGGVCYFLWKRDERGECKVVTNRSGKEPVESVRPLLEPGMETFIRDPELISIREKVASLNEPSFSEVVSANDPYGFDVRVAGSYKRVKPNIVKEPFAGSIKIYYNGWRRDGIGYIARDAVNKGQDMIDSYRLFVPRVWGAGKAETDWVNPFFVDSGACSTETYLTIGPFSSREEAENAFSYTQTKFFHIMVSLIKNTQQAMQRVYTYVPLQDFSRAWCDADLYAKYGLSNEEIAYIDQTVRHEGE